MSGWQFNQVRAIMTGCAALTASVAPIPALADVKAGVDAWSRGDHAAAIREWQPLAIKGDADAQFNMAQAYKLGRGVPLDLKRAEEFYRSAALQGHLQAADNYGLLLFQNGKSTEALPWLQGSAERGEPRAMYIMGIAHFNGDQVGKDWVRAYALMSRAAASGMAQARRSLATMDGLMPLEQRQLGVSLASELERKAVEVRARQLAATDLGVKTPSAAGQATTWRDETITAGADFANPVALPRPKRVAGSATPAAVPKPAPTKPEPKPAVVKAAATPPARTGGNWRVQLGAFGQKSNADALWGKARARPELAGHKRIDIPSGAVTRLLAGGFAGQADAAKACAALKSGGIPCLVLQP